ncbi:MAG: IS200/IS605 family transposase [Thermoplasmata archaeon]
MFGYYEPLRFFCQSMFERIAETYGFEIKALEIMDDHIHLFVGIGPNYSVSDTVRNFKSISAREMFGAFEWLKEYKPGEPRFWGGNFWSRGYFYRSVGSTTSEAVEFCINVSQKEELRDKYYARAKDGKRSCGEDPYLEYKMGNLDLQRISNTQATLRDFTS